MNEAGSGSFGRRKVTAAVCSAALMLAAFAFAPGLLYGGAQQAGQSTEAVAAQDRALEATVREIAAALRCPTCRSLSVYDSPSEMARQMRSLIRDQLRSGMTADEIKAYYVERYGEWILLKPKATGLNWLVWLLPVAILFGGLLFVLLTARRWVERGREQEAALLENVDTEV